MQCNKAEIVTHVPLPPFYVYPYLRANKIYYKYIYQPVLLEDLQWSIVHDIQNCIHKLGQSDLREFLQICQCILYT